MHNWKYVNYNTFINIKIYENIKYIVNMNNCYFKGRYTCTLKLYKIDVALQQKYIITWNKCMHIDYHHIRDWNISSPYPQ